LISTRHGSIRTLEAGAVLRPSSPLGKKPVRASLPPQQRMEKQQESKYLEFEADEAGRDQLRTPQKSNASPSLPGRSQQEGGPFPQLPVLIATSKGKMLGTRPHPAVSESCSMYRSSDAPAPCVFNSNFQGEERFLGCCSASAHVSTCAHGPSNVCFLGPRVTETKAHLLQRSVVNPK
jgi:hypothetical protein